MKKLLFVIVLAFVLAGCGSQEKPVFETVGNVDCQKPELPAAGKIDVYLPEEAAAQTMSEGEDAQVYTWDSYEVRMETHPSGNIAATMQTLTGMNADALTIMKQEKGDMTLYQTVWSATGEDGILCGRAMVADDGSHHYCVCLMSPEDVNSEDLYAKMVGSFYITPADAAK